LSPSLSFVNWPTDLVSLDFHDASPLNVLVAVKIAFEFLALLSGTAICMISPQLNTVRSALKRQDKKTDAFDVEPLVAPNYAPFHGICFDGNDPYVKIQVRLFGKLAYRVHLRHLALKSIPRIVYTHNLKSGEEEVRKWDTEAVGEEA
jgi:hypothetical protein